jgi:hypothetical protein
MATGIATPFFFKLIVLDFEFSVNSHGTEEDLESFAFFLMWI